MANTVRIGLADLHAAILTQDDSSALTYDTPFKIAPAVSASLSPKVSDDAFYADDGAMISNHLLSTVEVEIETADISPENVAKLLGSKIDAAGAVVQSSNDVAPEVALLWRSKKSNGKYVYYQLCKGTFGIDKDEYKTQEDKIDYQTSKLKGTFIPTINNGQWRVYLDEEAGKGGTDAAIKAWFTTVYKPTGGALASEMAMYSEEPMMRASVEPKERKKKDE